MERKKLIASLLTEQRITSEIWHRYLSEPREYGNGNWMYMYEAHLIAAVGTKDITMAALSDKLGLTQPVLVQQLNRLELKGYLVRTQLDGFEKGQELINLTVSGLDVYKGHSVLDLGSYSYVDRALSRYSDDQLCKLIEYEMLMQNIFAEENGKEHSK